VNCTECICCIACSNCSGLRFAIGKRNVHV
jgi:hypothetical protein